jgi:ribosomal protein S18 acetylase RimI-like enzyme
MVFDIREARRDDAEALSAVASRTFALACPPSTPAHELASFIALNLQPAHFLEQLDADSKTVLVVENDGAVVGYSLANHAPGPVGVEAADHLPELTRCYLLPEMHGSGAAQQLFDATLKLMTGPVRLTVSIENLRAQRFYARNGFATVGATTFPCGDQLHEDLVMVRPAAI